MSPIAFKVLSTAYEVYLKTGDYYITIQARNPTEWYDTVTGLRQLSQSGYIDEASDFVLASHISASVTEPITFNITELGIKYIRSKRESD